MYDDEEEEATDEDGDGFEGGTFLRLMPSDVLGLEFEDAL